MTLTSGMLAGSVLLMAGIYQFSSLKQVCLDHCRSPMQFLVERRRSGHLGTFIMGLEHGAFCLGCCWFLMAVLFVGGIMNLYWIAGLAIVVALEKLAPMGGGDLLKQQEFVSFSVAFGFSRKWQCRVLESCLSSIRTTVWMHTARPCIGLRPKPFTKRIIQTFKLWQPLNSQKAAVRRCSRL